MTDPKALAQSLREIHAAKVRHFVTTGGVEAFSIVATDARLGDLLRAADALEAKPLDDPRLQELFMSAITGAMAFGDQGVNRPPVGHWLSAAWETGRATAEAPSCGACPGDGSICKSACRVAEESPPVAQPVEMSAEFTDSARAALMWLLWHHQGGSSPIGQPLRFALGMGAHEPLNASQIEHAKRWAATCGATTAEFHSAKGAQPMLAPPIDAIREVIRISDRSHPSWEIVKSWLAADPAAPATEFETRSDGQRVRVDRWEVAIRRIVALLWGNRRQFEVDDVVEAVRALAPAPNSDDEELVRAVLDGPAAPASLLTREQVRETAKAIIMEWSVMPGHYSVAQAVGSVCKRLGVEL